jgi:hypothetical protein
VYFQRRLINCDENAQSIIEISLIMPSQIVCRVVYCPGFSDPLSIMVPRTLTGMYDELSYKRLTPNSRNIHQQWLPLAPGLGCAGLFYFDTTNESLIQAENTRISELSGNSSRHDHIIHNHEDVVDNEDDEEDDDDSRQKTSTKFVMEQIASMQQQ